MGSATLYVKQKLVQVKLYFLSEVVELLLVSGIRLNVKWFRQQLDVRYHKPAS